MRLAWACFHGAVLLAACGRVGFEPLATPPADVGADTTNISGLVAHYPMDTTANGVVACSDPQLDGHCTLPDCPLAIAGQVDGGAAFDGNDIITLPATMLVGNAPYTVALWVDPIVDTMNGTLVSKPIPNFPTDVLTITISMLSGELIHETTRAGEPFDYLRSGSTIDLRQGGWHHVAASWDGTSKRIFIDGMLIGSEATTVDDADSVVLLASDVDGQVPMHGYIGAMDDVRFYDRALDTAEVAALAGLP